jgi:hypothetical protein
VVDEDQRRDLLRRAGDEVRRAGREHGWDSPQARAEQQRRLDLERGTAAELDLPYADRVDLGVTWDAGAPTPVLLSGLRTFVAFYSAHEVKNSSWIAELMQVDRAHERFDESQWTGRRHFVLTFHDETLECVAKWTITRTAPGATMPEVLARLSAEAL